MIKEQHLTLAVSLQQNAAIQLTDVSGYLSKSDPIPFGCPRPLAGTSANGMSLYGSSRGVLCRRS